MPCLRNWINLLKIPSDNDANGIVIRILNHKYYLYPHTLRFIDPYIEVEYNMSLRRKNISKLSNICIFNICISIHQMFALNMNDSSKPDVSEINSIHASNIVDSLIIIIHMLIFVLMRIKRLSYSFNWIYISMIFTCISILIIEKNTIDFYIYAKTFVPNANQHMTLVWTNILTFETKLNLSASYFYHGLPYQIFIANTIVCLVYLHVLSFIEVAIFLVYFLFLICGFCIYSRLCFDQYFKNDHVYQYLVNDNTIYPILFFMNANQTQYDSFITTIKQNLPFPFTKSYADYEHFLYEQVQFVVVYWIIFSCIVISITRYKDLNSRENFILKRVRSNKDDSRLHDASKNLNSIIKDHEHSSDEGVLENNIHTLGEIVLQTFAPIDSENNTVISELINNAKQLVVENYTLSEALYES